MFGFQRYTRLRPRLILIPQGRKQSLSLGINPVDNAESCHPHDKIVGSHLCDECTKLILPNVCRKPESNLWLLLQNCWQTKECFIYQLVPSTSISSICENTFDNSPTDSSSSFLNWWSPRQRLSSLYNCSTFFLPAGSISQRFLEPVLPCHRTTRLFLREVFLTLVTFQLLQQKYVIQTCLYIPHQWFHSVCIHVE